MLYCYTTFPKKFAIVICKLKLRSSFPHKTLDSYNPQPAIDAYILLLQDIFLVTIHHHQEKYFHILCCGVDFPSYLRRYRARSHSV